MTAGGGGGGGGVGSWYEKYYKQLGPGQIEHLKKWFDSVDKDRSGSIDANELSNMIMPGTGNYAGRKIGLPAAKSLINLFDYNHSGSIGSPPSLLPLLFKLFYLFPFIYFSAHFPSILIVCQHQ